jgi:large subunit ribosomal protein L15
MRGGKGRAGGRKHFWIRTVKYEPERYEKKGFTPPSALEPAPEIINVGDLKELLFKTMGPEGLRDGTGLDLTAMGFDKLLGRGKVDIALDINVSSYSSSALDKIESAGGTLVEE